MGRTLNISAAMCARGRTISQAALSPDGSVVAFGTGDRLITVPSDGGLERVVAVDPRPGPFAWTADGNHIVYASKSLLCRVPATGGPGEVLAEADGPITSFAVSAGGRLAWVVDMQRLHVPDAGRVHTCDFVFDLDWSPDGRTLAWHEWDVPNMPWDEGRIMAMDLGVGVDGGAVRVVASGAAVQQPRFSPDGRLAYLSDATGWLNVWIEGDAQAKPVLDEPFEHGDPPWFPGQRSFCWSPDGSAIALNRNEAGFGRLLRVDVATGEAVELRKGVHRSLTWAGEHVAAIRSGAKTPTQVVVGRTTVAVGPVGGFEPALVEPELVGWEADDGAVVHGRLHRPPRPLDDGLPPLIVQIHGGPTGQNQVIFDAKTTYWVDRGWAVLVPDMRGSTGWGRAWAQALRGQWGAADVADVAAGMRAAARHGWGDPERMVVMGGSSGGMTVLLLLAEFGDLCAAGVALYPVTDLVDLEQTTHRFEAHYNAALAVDPARSPINHAQRITKPLLLFHGTDDVDVPVDQSRRMAELVPHAVLVEYPGEGHGFRQAPNVEDQLTRTEAWLAQTVLGFPE